MISRTVFVGGLSLRPITGCGSAISRRVGTVGCGEQIGRGLRIGLCGRRWEANYLLTFTIFAGSAGASILTIYRPWIRAHTQSCTIPPRRLARRATPIHRRTHTSVATGRGVSAGHARLGGSARCMLGIRRGRISSVRSGAGEHARCSAVDVV